MARIFIGWTNSSETISQLTFLSKCSPDIFWYTQFRLKDPDNELLEFFPFFINFSFLLNLREFNSASPSSALPSSALHKNRLSQSSMIPQVEILELLVYIISGDYESRVCDRDGQILPITAKSTHLYHKPWTPRWTPSSPLIMYLTTPASRQRTAYVHVYVCVCVVFPKRVSSCETSNGSVLRRTSANMPRVRWCRFPILCCILVSACSRIPGYVNAGKGSEIK